MKYQRPNWPYSPALSPQHSTEVERRLTMSEANQAWQDEINEDTKDKLEAHDRRLNLHEKAILAIGAVLQILMQDKYPTLAAVIKAMLP